MASQTNHNAAYLYSVDGLTPWDKLRNIRNFLTQHKQNLAMAELGVEKHEYMLSKLGDSTEDSFRRREATILQGEADDARKKCKDEIAFLEKLEQELITITEPTRIKGKTDDEMYEINYYNELATMIVRKAHCDIISGGNISPNVLAEVIRCKPALEILSAQGVLQLEAVNTLTQYDRPDLIEYTNVSFPQLGMG